MIAEEKESTQESPLEILCREDTIEMLKKGVPLAEIGRLRRTTRQAVWGFAKHTGNYEMWKRRVKRNRLIANKREQLKKRVIKLWENKEALEINRMLASRGWAAEKTVEYRTKVPRSTYSWKQLYKIFRRYEKALNEGKKLSLSKLGKKSGINFPQVGRMLKIVELKPISGTIDDFVLESRKKREVLLERSLQVTYMTGKDIAYFLRLTGDIVNAYSRKHGKETNAKMIKSTQNERLSYKKASKIYAAADDGKSIKQIVSALGIERRLVSYAWTHRKKIAPLIVNALNIFYDKKFDKPYLKKRDRK